MNIYHIRFIYNWTYIAIVLSTYGKREQAVELGNQAGIHLNGRGKLCKSYYQFVEKTRFHRKNAVFGTHNLLFVFLQFLSYIAFCLCQCLLANPLSRNKVFVGVSYFQIIAEHIIISYLQALDARSLYLALLNV